GISSTDGVLACPLAATSGFSEVDEEDAASSPGAGPSSSTAANPDKFKKMIDLRCMPGRPGHLFHSECLYTWLHKCIEEEMSRYNAQADERRGFLETTTARCPVCRQQISREATVDLLDLAHAEGRQKKEFREVENSFLEEFCLKEAEGQLAAVAQIDAQLTALAADHQSTSGSLLLGGAAGSTGASFASSRCSGSGRGGSSFSAATLPLPYSFCGTNYTTSVDGAAAPMISSRQQHAAGLAQQQRMRKTVLPKYRNALQFFKTSLKYKSGGRTRRRICEVVLDATLWACRNGQERDGMELLDDHLLMAKEVDAEALRWQSFLRNSVAYADRF
ncbi:unnamed protein product, partial [Amoebophrya sp. A120]